MCPEVTFEEELAVLLKSGLQFEDLAEKVADLHRRHGREVPPPITGTMAITEPEDKFGG